MSVASTGGPEVLVNLLWLVPGVVGGSEESVTDALRSLHARDGDLRLRLAVLEPFLEAHPDLVEAHPVEVLRLDGRDKARRVLAEQTWLARTTRSRRPALVHHAGGTVPLVHPGRSVLTIQDLQPLDLPHNFSRTKRTYLHSMIGRSARAADVVCVPSEFTRDRVLDRLGVPAERVRVVPWHVRPAPAEVPAVPPDVVPDGPYLLYPAITYPHKNHLVLLEAVARLDDDVTLVLTGGAGPDEAEVMARVDRLGLGDRVRRPGRVPAAHLEALYAAAAAVVVPSRYEGFGLPALEAMERGCPVVVSAAGSLPEVVRAEDLVPADDVTAWAEAVQAVLSLAPEAREQRIAAGREAAARFSAARTAEGLHDVYHALVQR